jgi:SNF1-activating kinase 1
LKWKSQDGQPDLTLDETRRIFRDVVCGLQYRECYRTRVVTALSILIAPCPKVHHQGIIHRDIKPANLLFGEGDVVKISDFGVSHYSHVLRGASDLEEGESPEDDDPAFMDDHELAKTAGSPAFFAPELCYNGDTTPLSSITPGREKGEFNYPSFNAAVGRARPESSAVGGTAARSDTPTGHSRRSRPPITEAIDVWALGVTLYCLLFGKVPFEAPSEYALFSIIPIDDYEIPPYLGADKLPTGGRHSYKAGKASGIAEEVREVLDILEKLLEKDPTKRIKLPEVKVCKLLEYA